MPSFRTARLVEHRPGEMFDLVADVEAYPKFLPLCESLVVRSRRDVPNGELIVATMTVGYGMIRESFTSRVVIDRPRLLISTEYLDGPFDHLTSVWTFTPEPEERTTVGFSIDYALRSRMLQMLVGAVFDSAFRRFVEAFQNRADVVYGVRESPRRAAGSSQEPPA